MPTIIGSSDRNCALIILFPLNGSKAGLFECHLFWMGQSYDPSTFTLEEKLIHY